MNKRVNFEDTIFILNIRIRMIRDILRLDTDAGFFLPQTIQDMDFINSTMDMLNEKFFESIKFLDRETEADNLLDAEWHFVQLINEISGISSPFSPEKFPEMKNYLDKFRKTSEKRQKLIESSSVPMSHISMEPIVSHAELNGLLGSA